MSEKIGRNTLSWIRLPLKRPALLLINMLLIAGFTALGPLERTLGAAIRIVYLHGAWVWTAKIIFGLAAQVTIWVRAISKKRGAE